MSGSSLELTTRVGGALAIGLLLGLERGWQLRELPEGERVAGFRTFGLLSLLGAVASLVSNGEPAVVAAALLAVGAIVAVGYLRTSRERTERSATGMVAALLAFALGAMAGRGDVETAAAIAVVATMLLGAKPELHRWLRTIEREELLATFRLLLISVVALPVLPDRGFGPWGVLNPYRIWWMVVLVAAVSYVGYLAKRLWGRDRGTLIGGVIGGLVSSTAVTIALSRRASADRGGYERLTAATVVASAIMFLRILAILAPMSIELCRLVFVPVAAAAAVAGSAAALFVLRARRTDGRDVADALAVENPLDLASALKFGLLLSAILVVSRALIAALGDRGLYLGAAAAGLADVDAITLSIAAMMNRGEIAGATAVGAVLLAAATNTAVKSALAITIGGRRFGARVAISLVAALVGGTALWAILLA
jgi:uncharacterized membrane protein (DUF4010 family)